MNVRIKILIKFCDEMVQHRDGKDSFIYYLLGDWLDAVAQVIFEGMTLLLQHFQPML